MPPIDVRLVAKPLPLRESNTARHILCRMSQSPLFPSPSPLTFLDAGRSRFVQFFRQDHFRSVGSHPPKPIQRPGLQVVPDPLQGSPAGGPLARIDQIAHRALAVGDGRPKGLDTHVGRNISAALEQTDRLL